MTNAFDFVADQPWACTEEALRQILEISSREHTVDLDALAAKLGRPLDNARDVEMRDSTAIIPVKGPIFRYASLFSKISGATSTQALATDFGAAMDNPQVTDVILTFDSPGGAVSGINELSGMIFDARGKKPIVSYVGTQAASAAYWIASAADQVVAEDSATLGSLGVIASFRKSADSKTVDIVSSRAPYKREDLSTEEGMARVKALVDSLEHVFFDRVASNMGVSVDKVASDFGKGGMMSGRNAVVAGMAHRSGSLEGLIGELKARRASKMFSAGRVAANSNKGAVQMTEQEIQAMQARLAALESDNAVKASALEAEKKRAEKADAMAAQVETLAAKLTETEKNALATAQALQASEDARTLSAFTAQAEKELPFIAGKPEEKGATLKALYSSLPKEQADSILTMLRAGNAAAATAFKSKGRDASGPSSPAAQLTVLAKEIEARDKLKPGSGMEKAIREHPDLYEASKEESRVN